MGAFSRGPVKGRWGMFNMAGVGKAEVGIDWLSCAASLARLSAVMANVVGLWILDCLC